MHNSESELASHLIPVATLEFIAVNEDWAPKTGLGLVPLDPQQPMKNEGFKP